MIRGGASGVLKGLGGAKGDGYLATGPAKLSYDGQQTVR